MKKGIKIKITGWHIDPIKLSWLCKHKFKPMFVSGLSRGFSWTSEEFTAGGAMLEYFQIYDLGVYWEITKSCDESRKFTFKVTSPEYTGDGWSGVFSVRWGTKQL